jgi:predicted Ser/Thr protein kinase
LCDLMDKERKPSLVARLLGGRQRSLSAVSRKEPEKDKEKEKEDTTILAKPQLSRHSSGPAVPRTRSGTAPLSRSSYALPTAEKVDKEKDKEENENPTSVEQLPRPFRDFLADSSVARPVMNEHFETTLRALRLTAKKELRRYAFLRGRGKEGEEEEEDNGAAAGSEPGREVFEEVKTEKELRKRFKVGEEIGKGAFGAVYEGRQEGRQVALKKICHMGRRQMQRNTREAYFLTQCRHEKIMQVLACLRAADTSTVWLVMELIEGGSLDEALKLSGALPDKEAARVCADMLEALAYLHGRGLAHRDIKVSRCSPVFLFSLHFAAGQRDAGAVDAAEAAGGGEAGGLFSGGRPESRSRSARAGHVVVDGP